MTAKQLYPSFAPPETWRDQSQKDERDGVAWKELRLQILQRDEYTCAYCAYRSEKYQIVDHIDGNPKNNKDNNLQVICQMCSLIKHAGQGCVIQGIVDLYEKAQYNQNDVTVKTRKLRDEGKSDPEIIVMLGLKRRAEFKMDRNYLQRLIGFVTSRQTRETDSMYNGWLRYHHGIINDRKNTLNNYGEQNK